MEHIIQIIVVDTLCIIGITMGAVDITIMFTSIIVLLVDIVADHPVQVSEEICILDSADLEDGVMIQIK